MCAEGEVPCLSSQAEIILKSSCDWLFSGSTSADNTTVTASCEILVLPCNTEPNNSHYDLNNLRLDSHCIMRLMLHYNMMHALTPDAH